MKKIHEKKNSKKFNSTVDKVHLEMDSVGKRLGNANLKWEEKYSDVYCYNLQFKLEDEIAYLESIYDGLYDLSMYYDDSPRVGQAIKRETLTDEYGEDFVCEFRKLNWILSNKKLVRNITFVNTGEVFYAQVRKNDNIDSYDYYASYNVNNNDLSLKIKNNEDDISFVNTDVRKYSFSNKTILENEEVISLIERIGENTSLLIELNRAGNVVRKHLNLGDYNYVIEGNDIVCAFVNDVSLDIDAEVWVNVMHALNNFEIGKLGDNEIFNYINEIKLKVIHAIKFIKGEVLLDGLSKRLDIALSMISTKKIFHVSSDNKVLKKK